MTTERVPRDDRRDARVARARIGWWARWSYHYGYPYGWCDATTWRPTEAWARRVAIWRVTRRPTLGERAAWQEIDG